MPILLWIFSLIIFELLLLLSFDRIECCDAGRSWFGTISCYIFCLLFLLQYFSFSYSCFEFASARSASFLASYFFSLSATIFLNREDS